MAGDSKGAFLQKWRALSPNRRMLIAGGGGLGVVIILGVALGSPAPDKKLAAKDKPATNFNLPVSKDLSVEQLSAQIEAMKHTLLEVQSSDQKLHGVMTEKTANQNDVVKELRDLRLEMDKLKSQKASAPEISLEDQLPPDGFAPGGAAGGGNISSPGRRLPNADQRPPEVERPRLRVVAGEVGGRNGSKSDSKTSQEEEDPTIYMPAGSNFEGVLMNGMDAPTNGSAKSNPTPALIRLDTDAILPSRHRYDVRECFALVTGFGVMSTERAQLQTTVISCIKTDGSVIEAKLQGYVVGEDGKVGLRGRLVTKQGALLARSFMTGFFSGIGTAMTANAVPQLNVNPGSTQQYQSPNVSQMLASGTAQGVSDTARTLSRFYLDMAKEMFPVIEIDAMRRVTIILVKGVELSMTGEGKK